MIFRMALHGLKSSGAEFCTHLVETLNENGFLSTKVDPNVWYQPTVKPNGFEYYYYIRYYVNNILCISHNPGIAIRLIQAIFKFKGNEMEEPKIYLVVQVKKMLADGSEGC